MEVIEIIIFVALEDVTDSNRVIISQKLGISQLRVCWKASNWNKEYFRTQKLVHVNSSAL